LGGVAPSPNIAPVGGASAAGVSAGATLEDVAELITFAQNTQEVVVAESSITDTQKDVSVIEDLQR